MFFRSQNAILSCFTLKELGVFCFTFIFFFKGGWSYKLLLAKLLAHRHEQKLSFGIPMVDFKNAYSDVKCFTQLVHILLGNNLVSSAHVHDTRACNRSN